MDDSGATGTDDRALAEAVLDGGDESAFRELYRRHTPRLYMLMLRFLGGVEHDAEDIVQETWMRACEGLDRFRWDSAFSTWLRRIGVHVAVDFLRRRGRNPAVAGVEGFDPPASPLPLDERIDLEEAIARLPEGLRQVVVLHDVEGMTHGEIAELLGVAEGTSKSQLFSARKALRQLLGPSEGE
jgi:RNA polymerase sigma-70 factor (ECF subfamily)